MKKKTKLYLSHLLVIAIIFFWLGTLTGAVLADNRARIQSEQYRVEMVKDSLYYEYTKQSKK